MFVARHIDTGLYLKSYSHGTRDKVPLDQARVYHSERGARSSLTYGSPSRNPGLLVGWEIVPLRTAIAQQERQDNG